MLAERIGAVLVSEVDAARVELIHGRSPVTETDGSARHDPGRRAEAAFISTLRCNRSCASKQGGETATRSDDIVRPAVLQP